MQHNQQAVQRSARRCPGHKHVSTHGAMVDGDLCGVMVGFDGMGRWLAGGGGGVNGGG